VIIKSGRERVVKGVIRKRVERQHATACKEDAHEIKLCLKQSTPRFIHSWCTVWSMVIMRKTSKLTHLAGTARDALFSSIGKVRTRVRRPHQSHVWAPPAARAQHDHEVRSKQIPHPF